MLTQTQAAQLTQSPVLQQRKVANILFDEFHSESWTMDAATALRMQPNHPADSSYVQAAAALRERDFVVMRNTDQPLINSALDNVDVLVIAHPSEAKWERTTSGGSPLFTAEEIAAIHDFVHSGGGLIVLGETEHDKYGNNLNALLQPFGIRIENATLTDHVHCYQGVPSWVLVDHANTTQSLHGAARQLPERVQQACFLRAGTLCVEGEAQLILQASASASIPHAGLVAAAHYGAGRVVVLADSDLFGDDDLGKFDHMQLWLNTCYWVAQPAFARHSAGQQSITPSPAWQPLKDATNALRRLQQADGSVTEADSQNAAGAWVSEMQTAIRQMQPVYPHQESYLEHVQQDLQMWVDNGFGKPNFAASLAAFRPEQQRVDGIEHLVVFPLYTPNGSPDVRFEALRIRTPWPAWLAELERTQYDNSKFVPLHFMDHTDGYASECAVLFPETVSVANNKADKNYFGGIFCDREAERYQRVVSAACQVLSVNLPPHVAAFLGCADLIRDTFALWDLIHDRWHSHGELPFDPFMIRQRLPFWMYALEELRVDLQTYQSATALEKQGFAFAGTVKYGILFDRMFRFPITGNRVRNYDGLSGQLLFAFLHQRGVVGWRDNACVIDWANVDAGMEALRERIEQLYRNGIDMSRVQYWLAAHDLVSEWVKPNVGSRWARETRVLSDESQPKEWINRVLDDEFPLSLFYLQLQKKLVVPKA